MEGGRREGRRGWRLGRLEAGESLGRPAWVAREREGGRPLVRCVLLLIAVTITVLKGGVGMVAW